MDVIPIASVIVLIAVVLAVVLLAAVFGSRGSDRQAREMLRKRR